MRRSLSIGGSSSVQWQKVGRSWRLRMCFRRLLCVRIEIDQLHCMNCWVIIHCMEVSCTKINHSCCALVIWSSLQLTSKQWIITQQFTAGADLFLKCHPLITFANSLGRLIQTDWHSEFLKNWFWKKTTKKTPADCKKAYLTLYSIITPFDTHEISRIWKYYGKWSICSFGAIASFSIIFSKVFKT